jgi:hypothetical protein
VFAGRSPAWHSVLTKLKADRNSSVGKEQDTGKIPAMDRCAEALPSFPCPHPDDQRKNRSEKYGESKKKTQIHAVREKNGNSNGSVFSLHSVPTLRLFFPPVPPSKSRQPPEPRVQGAGGDLSSDSSEGHTDVARRDESRRTPGLVNSSGCLHTGSRRHVLACREVKWFYDRTNGTVN